MSSKVAGSRSRGKQVSRRQSQLQKQWRRREQRIRQRLDKHAQPDAVEDSVDRPVLQGSNLHCSMSERYCGTAYGGVAVIHQLVRELGLAQRIDRHLHILQCHRPYHESDHVLNFAYNALCDGDCLEDMELRRQDEGYLNALGARRTTDPTTAGDFCRRFNEWQIRTLMNVFHTTRQIVWKRQSASFFEEAVIDMDGTYVSTDAEKMEGIDINYKGQWGYHVLVTSLANTGEVLSLVNRSGNRPSHEGAAQEADSAITVCRRAGFRRIRLRGDTDFTQTKELDRWDQDGVIFVFGKDSQDSLGIEADDLAEEHWKVLQRPARYRVKTKPREKREPIKEAIVKQRDFRNLRLLSEEVAEMDYKPHACKRSYRLIIVRKNLERYEGQGQLFQDYRYFYYLTNDRDSSVEEIVFEANHRCNQENLHAQLKHGVCALTTPTHSLLSNWAYMVMTSLAWSLKAWLALWLPASPRDEAKSDEHKQQRLVLRMEFKSFVNQLMRLPAIVAHSGRRILLKFISWSPLQPVLFRFMEAIRPLRC